MAHLGNGRQKRFVMGMVSTVAAGVALGALAFGGTANATPFDGNAQAAKPTVVLEHGAFADPDAAVACRDRKAAMATGWVSWASAAAGAMSGITRRTIRI